MDKISRLTKQEHTFTISDLSWSRHSSSKLDSALDHGKVRRFWGYFGIFPFVSRFSYYKTFLASAKYKQACLLLSAYETLRCYGIAPFFRMEIYSKYPPKHLLHFGRRPSVSASRYLRFEINF